MGKTHQTSVGKRRQPKSAPCKSRRHYKDGSKTRKTYSRQLISE